MRVFISSKSFCLFYSQINALLFFSRALSGSNVVKKSSENRERLGTRPSSLLNSLLLVGREVWSQYNLASWGQVYILCLLGPHPYAYRAFQSSSAGTSPD